MPRYRCTAAFSTRFNTRYGRVQPVRRASAEILVNNRYDPSTPLHGARDGTAELAKARVFVIEGYGQLVYRAGQA